MRFFDHKGVSFYSPNPHLRSVQLAQFYIKTETHLAEFFALVMR